MFRASANILLWAFIAVAVVIVGFLAVDLGLVDAVFRTTTQDGLQSWKKVVRGHLSRSEVDYALKILGLTLSGIGIVLTAMRLWEYAERNLPTRLQKLVEKLKAFHFEDRELLLAPYATRNLARDPILQDVRGVFDRLLGVFGYDRRTREEARILQEAKEASDYMKTVEEALARSKSLSVSALILEAAKTAFDSEAQKSGQGTHLAALQKAEALVENALKIDPHDLDALELAAKIAAARNDDREALKFLARLEKASEAAERSVRHARALRLKADIASHKTTFVARRDTKDQLVMAANVIKGVDMIASARERHLEEAQIHEQLAGIYILRNTLSYVQPSIKAAQDAYRKVGGAERLGSDERLRHLAERKRAAEEAGEAPEGDTDVPQGRAFVPTYFTTRGVDMLVAPGGAKIVSLDANTGVRFHKRADNGAFIKISSGQVGFVAGDVLQRLG